MTFCTSGQALIKAGKSVSPDFEGLDYTNGQPVSGAVTLRLRDPRPIATIISGAEAVICAVTRKNYVSKYATLPIGKRLILQDACSNLAGIYLINYDMSSFSSRVEAEDHINILRDGFLRNISILRDKKAQDYVEDAT